MTLATTGLTCLGTCWKLKLDLARARILICACAYCVSASASAFPFANLTWDLCRPSLNTVATFKGLYARRSRHLNRSVASRAPLTVSHLVAVPALSTAPPSARLLPQRFPLQGSTCPSRIRLPRAPRSTRSASSPRLDLQFLEHSLTIDSSAPTDPSVTRAFPSSSLSDPSTP